MTGSNATSKSVRRYIVEIRDEKTIDSVRFSAWCSSAWYTYNRLEFNSRNVVVRRFFLAVCRERYWLWTRLGYTENRNYENFSTVDYVTMRYCYADESDNWQHFLRIMSNAFIPYNGPIVLFTGDFYSWNSVFTICLVTSSSSCSFNFHKWPQFVFFVPQVCWTATEHFLWADIHKVLAYTRTKDSEYIQLNGASRLAGGRSSKCTYSFRNLLYLARNYNFGTDSNNIFVSLAFSYRSEYLSKCNRCVQGIQIIAFQTSNAQGNAERKSNFGYKTYEIAGFLEPYSIESSRSFQYDFVCFTCQWYDEKFSKCLG